MDKYDVVVIGAGPGGYVAAIRAGQLGLKVACVDRWRDGAGKPALGGTCLNVGCIPSKALLDSSLHYHNLTHLLPAHGIRIDGAGVDIPTMQKRKDKVTRILKTGIEGLFKKNKVTWFPGQAAFLARDRLRVCPALGDRGKDSKENREFEVAADNVIIATGSAPMRLSAVPVDNERIVDSTGALNFAAVPERLGIIGAGVIGLELGSVWNRLGAKVVLLEAADRFLPETDREVAKEAERVFTKQGLDIRLGASVDSATVSGEEKPVVGVGYEAGGERQSMEVDRLVVACGRTPVTAGLALENAGLATDERGRIPVDGNCRTGVDGVYAIGDVVRGPMLAHKASEEGMAVAERIAGQAPPLGYETIPWVIYTHPEIAWVGRTEESLQADGIRFRKGRFPLRALGRAHGSGETEGFIKILGDAETDRILGAHLFGNHASELIAEVVVAMEFSASTEDLARIVHAHPTLSEGIHEAALAVAGRAIHF
uniref:Dihydrolipoyl dehydrogenase n=1 Tax=Candidatus Kentrum sp. DK TaxID=2126562 RepID=A0A450S1G4_9GAMM|nr:MAG: dihydrolipoamide dehydrogenase [Candidatus Kentron sp. DK]